MPSKSKIIIQEIDDNKSMSWADVARQPAKTTNKTTSDNKTPEEQYQERVRAAHEEDLRQFREEELSKMNQPYKVSKNEQLDEWKRQEEEELARYHRAYDAYIQELKNNGGIG